MGQEDRGLARELKSSTLELCEEGLAVLHVIVSGHIATTGVAATQPTEIRAEAGSGTADRVECECNRYHQGR